MTLRHLPLPLLAVPMGLGGLGMAWRKAVAALGAPAWPGEALMVAALLAWAAMTALHLWRWRRHPEAVAEDWAHPFRAPIFAAGSISTMVAAGALLPWAPRLAAALLVLAVALHLVIGLILIARVFRGEGSAAMLVPPLLFPLVGNIVAPLVAAPLGWLTLGWMLLGVGALLWVMVMPLLLWRMLEGPGLPPPLRPSLAILLAPPTVGALSVAALAGTGPWVVMLYGLSAFILALLMLALPHILADGFSPPVWSFTFPIANFAAVTMMVAHGALAWMALLGATAVVGLISAATIRAALHGRLLAPPPAQGVPG